MVTCSNLRVKDLKSWGEALRWRQGSSVLCADLAKLFIWGSAKWQGLQPFPRLLRVSWLEGGGLAASIPRTENSHQEGWGRRGGWHLSPSPAPPGARCSPGLPALWARLATPSPAEKPSCSWRPRGLDLPFLLLQPRCSCFLSCPSQREGSVSF